MDFTRARVSSLTPLLSASDRETEYLLRPVTWAIVEIVIFFELAT